MSHPRRCGSQASWSIRGGGLRARAGGCLAPYLAKHVSLGKADQPVDRAPVGPKAAGETVAKHQEVRELALAFGLNEIPRLGRPCLLACGCWH